MGRGFARTDVIRRMKEEMGEAEWGIKAGEICEVEIRSVSKARHAGARKHTIYLKLFCFAAVARFSLFCFFDPGSPCDHVVPQTT